MTSMLRAEVLSVGTELLMGQIANTNAQYISRCLPEVGVGVFYHSVVGDNPARFQDALLLAMSRADVILTTGGLGPTQDDLTKETIGNALGLTMELHPESEAAIRGYFQRTGREMADNNLRQAYFPKGSIIMDNEMGTAPGCIIQTSIDGEEKTIILLPGPPKELIPMFKRHVMPFFAKMQDTPLYSQFLRIVGVGESMVEQKLMALVEGQTNPTLATYAKDGVVTIRVTAHDEGEIPAKLLVAEMCNKICAILGHNVYATEDKEIEEIVQGLLRDKGLTFACAESCTGGMLAARMTAIPGASDIFKCGMVTYQEQSKTILVGVREETLKEFGAVSYETALEMVLGCIQVSNADVAVSITGYAGPAFADEPVGRVYIGVCAPGVQTVREFTFTGNRDRIRTLSVINALDLVRRALLQIE